MNTAKLRASIAYILEQFGVRTHDGEPPQLSADRDGFDMRIVLPYYRERVQLDAEVLIGNPAAAIDTVQAARDRLFRKFLEHMAKHDRDIASILERQSDDARVRAELAKILIAARTSP